MARRKASRYVKSAKSKEQDSSDEANPKNKMRLDDFDKQVYDMVCAMESEKKKVIDSVEHLYFIDEQRTDPKINKMLWRDYLKLNDPNATSVSVRRSVVEIANLADTIKVPRTRGRKANATPATSMRLRTRTKSSSSQDSVAETPVVRTSSRGSKKKVREELQTPINQGIPRFPSSIITPKFDPKTPVPLSALRKPKIGEIMVSFSGSPVQVENDRPDFRSLITSNLENVSVKELEDLKERVNSLLTMSSE